MPQIDDLMARREVRAPSNWHDEHGDTRKVVPAWNNGTAGGQGAG